MAREEAVLAFEKTRYEERDGGAWITLDSPSDRNALSQQLISELHARLDVADASPSVRCIVLTGEGGAFCAGANLKAAPRRADSSGDRNPFVDLLLRLWNSPKPVIAAVNGAAFGGGLGLVGAADIVIASSGAKFSFSEVHLGVIPAMISVVCLPKLGIHQATRLFLTGERFGAEDAVRYGLAHKAVDDQDLGPVLAAEVALIRRGGPAAVAAAKQLIRDVPRYGLEAAFAYTENLSSMLFAGAEAAEGIAAFREKRPPYWVEGV